ncbi:hypothetical protein PSACC_00288 [Paramicrosporidium saccamoebae]|uniref:N-acetyltransferase ESCO zinc-finger domain-containing protein n=1 Tax=Paramicrosporidium saccamoebae TaxID=1246581 RepID=A0A2H9TQB1_9FUNG|nr:hypothetical protein PSACC_00288 [Paramicrosporidium saccamoebae]
MKTYSRKTAIERPDVCTVDDTLLAKVTPVKRTKITDYFFREPGAEKVVKRKPAVDHKSKSSSLQQTFLDLGQQDLFITSCMDCGMKYDRSFASDVKRHDIEHGRLMSCFNAEKVLRLY